MKVGIVGMPNAGKSSLFNALTRAGAEAANYPFTTIEPNVAIVPVADERIEQVAALLRSSEVVHDTIAFHDIAGLVRGASEGEGLGNKFLANIRETQAILMMVRCFDDPNVIHVSGSVDPMRDIDVIDLELALADVDSADKRLKKAQGNAKSGGKEAKAELALVEKVYKHLQDGKAARSLARDSATSPSRTSARSTRSCTSSARTRIRTSCTPRARSTPAPTSTRSRRS